jgi:hypothetical protein
LCFLLLLLLLLLLSLCVCVSHLSSETATTHLKQASYKWIHKNNHKRLVCRGSRTGKKITQQMTRDNNLKQQASKL